MSLWQLSCVSEGHAIITNFVGSRIGRKQIEIRNGEEKIILVKFKSEWKAGYLESNYFQYCQTG